MCGKMTEEEPNPSVDEEKEEDRVSEFPCPRCGKNQSSYPVIGGARSPMCKACNTLISASKIPSYLITKEEAKPRERKRSKSPPPSSDEETENETGGEDEEPPMPREPRTQTAKIFDTPPGPTQVLRQVLEEFELDENFIRLMVQRSERQGQLNPYDLRFYIKTLNSGIPKESKEEMSAYIADEFSYALQQSAKETEAMHVKFSYPSYGGRPRSEGPLPGRGLGGYDASGRSYPARSREEVGYGYGYPQEQKQLTSEEVARIIEDKLTREKKEERIDKLEHMILERDRAFTDKLADLNKQNMENMERIVGKIGESQRGFVTPGDLEKLMMQRESDWQKQMMAQQEKLAQMSMDFVRDRNRSLEEQNKELVKELKNPPKIDAGDFRTDEGRLAATALNDISSTLKDRKPIEIVVQGLTQLSGAPAPESLKKKKESESAKSRIAELVGKEYSETEGKE